MYLHIYVHTKTAHFPLNVVPSVALGLKCELVQGPEKLATDQGAGWLCCEWRYVLPFGSLTKFVTANCFVEGETCRVAE